MTQMDVTQAVFTRKSVRAFRSDPVSDQVILDLLATAARAPSGGNVQPWRIYVVNGESMAKFREVMATERAMSAGEYDMYPPDLWEPYRTNRYQLGEQMYATLGISREDKAGRLAQLARNEDFFGAPAGLFCFIDRRMGQPQWSDLGMFLQTFMLLATEAGLATCAQEYWSLFHELVTKFVGAPDEEMLFCGMAIGYADTTAPVNTLVSERMPTDQWVRFC
jgi:nitroreductase